MSSSEPWVSSFSRGLNKWASSRSTTASIRGVDVEIVSLRHPVLILSGATPGPFYHSHPHKPEEFDHMDFSMEAQVRSNIATIRKIAETVQAYNNEGGLPFELPKQATGAKEKSFRGIESPFLLNWIANIEESKNYPCGALDFASRLEVVKDITPKSCEEFEMNQFSVLANYETGGNVSDRRFQLETFAMFGIEEGVHPENKPHTFVQLDMKDIFDPQYFMPYVPGYAVSGGDIAIFTINASSTSDNRSVEWHRFEQVKAANENMMVVLKELGATFDDVIMMWDRVEDLDKHERAVLMTRSDMGLERPLAESVLEVNTADRNGVDAADVPLWIELVVVAQIPQRKQPAASAG
mmetsp:Transcript_7069/g.8767  ORF Transcript_7069/g.8767 Transcript_7069/m.8767 type:complete len:352 (-) Transcript_7069:5-1060(-)